MIQRVPERAIDMRVHITMDDHKQLSVADHEIERWRLVQQEREIFELKLAFLDSMNHKPSKD